MTIKGKPFDLSKYHDPRWQKKRLEILERDKWHCRCCGRTDIELHVHHLGYLKTLENPLDEENEPIQRWLDPWEYEKNCLITLCTECHEAYTEAHKQDQSIWQDTLSNLEARFGGRMDILDLACVLDQLVLAYLEFDYCPDESSHRKGIIHRSKDLLKVFERALVSKRDMHVRWEGACEINPAEGIEQGRGT